MFRSVLIANRGEIACRIIDTCRRMGVATVAVYSDADAGARHVEMADAAMRIGPAPASESYLDVGAIVAAALASGAQAVHPGYGFLSENPGFVDTVTAAGLVFVGPSADAIRAMGLKDAAKATMTEAGVPVVPGYHGLDQADVRLAQEAAMIGWPVLVKAVAGGGGKGMRVAESEAAFPRALAAARAEALAAFGNDRVLIEKLIERPRHVEIQVFGDGTRAIHLGERDCSLQRRHQKVIEEAPAPGMTAQLRAEMGAAAVRAAEAIGYAGAGTVEFICEGRPDGTLGAFHFMEMNTRLQVEHPVTEAVTGIDLVEWQLRVAAGEPLPLRQGEVALHGHAFEARLYAEDVEAGFLPATGVLGHLRFPDDARIETGVRAGDAVTPWYDPMIAKIVVSGSDRASALRSLRRSLDATEVAGTVTNLAFLRALARHAGFAAGDVDTGLIGRDLAELVRGDEPAAADVALAAIRVAGIGGAAAFALWSPLSWRVPLTFGGADVTAVLRVPAAGVCEVSVGDATVTARLGPGGWAVDGQAPRVVRLGDTVTVLGADPRPFGVPDPLDRTGGAAAGADVILAPMPGTVRQVSVGPGDRVVAGDRMCVLEAMKMEHALCAGRDGVVAEVMAETGGQVAAGDPLVRLEPVA